MKPIIGITASAMTSPRNGREYGRFYLERDYVDRVIEAGGTPILIPPGADAESCAALLNGLVIPGGGDFNAQLWGEVSHASAEPEYELRTKTEIDIYRALDKDVPILGICYGCQFVNVMMGGTLEQHLPDILGHDNHRGDNLQQYLVEPNTLLHSIVGSTTRGKSWHHQAVKKLGSNLKVCATHEDGTIEAIEAIEGRWFLGLQWHPERTDEEDSKTIFRAFADAVVENMRVRT